MRREAKKFLVGYRVNLWKEIHFKLAVNIDRNLQKKKRRIIDVGNASCSVFIASHLRVRTKLFCVFTILDRLFICEITWRSIIVRPGVINKLVHYPNVVNIWIIIVWVGTQRDSRRLISSEATQNNVKRTDDTCMTHSQFLFWHRKFSVFLFFITNKFRGNFSTIFRFRKSAMQWNAQQGFFLLLLRGVRLTSENKSKTLDTRIKLKLLLDKNWQHANHLGMNLVSTLVFLKLRCRNVWNSSEIRWVVINERILKFRRKDSIDCVRDSMCFWQVFFAG